MCSKKIGIITIDKGLVSFGCAFQCYATWKFLKNLGYDAEIIDIAYISQPCYIPSKRFPVPHQGMWLNFMHGLVVDIIKHPVRNYRFYKFNNLIDYSKKYRKVDYMYSTPPRYDVYLTGSDQTWNPGLVQNVEPFLLTFVGKDKKKISYAASFGISELPEKYKSLYRNALLEYSHLSVREQRGKEIVEELTGRDDVFVTLDPTLLLSKESYLSLASTCNFDNYVLAFFLTTNVVALMDVDRFARLKNLKLVVVGSKIKGIHAKFVSNAGPREWLGLIIKASFIVTDSFHGSVFSILFNRPFRVLVSDSSRASRIYTLMNNFLLQDQIITPAGLKSLDMNSFIYDKERVNKILDTLRSKSREWLINAIEF